MRVGLDRSRFPGSHVTPGAPARKEVFETALEGPARTQSDVFLVFSRTGNPLVRTVFLRGPRKLTKNSSTDFTLLATIVTIVAEQLNFDAQEAQYTTKTTTPVATEGDEEKKQNSEFSLVYFLALFLSHFNLKFKCAFCQRSLRQRRDALKSLLQYSPRSTRTGTPRRGCRLHWPPPARRSSGAAAQLQQLRHAAAAWAGRVFGVRDE